MGRPSTKLPAAKHTPHARRTPAQVGTLPMQPSLPPHVHSAPAAPPNAAQQLLGRVPYTPVELGRQLTRQQRPLMLHAALPIPPSAMAQSHWHAPRGTTALLKMLQPLMLRCRLSARTLSTLTAVL